MSDNNYKDINHTLTEEQGDVYEDMDYEDEDELARIELEEEPTMDDVMSELDLNQQEPEEGMSSQDDGQTVLEEKKGMGIGSMILGIFGILLFCVPVFGQILALAAVILGIIAVTQKKGKKFGISGISMGAISLIAALLVILGVGGVFQRSNVDEDTLVNAAWRRADDGSVLYLYDDGTFIYTDNEGDFTDNFYSGSYLILSYEDAKLEFSGIEKQYNTKYTYDVYLYVDQYVSNGEESENIAGTIRYLFMFDKKYTEEDTIHISAHDSRSYGDIVPVRRTELMKPSIGNRYEPAIAAEEDSETEETTDTTTEATASTENITTDASTEGTTELVSTEATEAATTESATIDSVTTEITTTKEVTTEETTTESAAEHITTSEVITEEVATEDGTDTEVTTEEVTTDESSTEDTSTDVDWDDLEEEASSAIEEIDNLIDDVVDDDTVNGIIGFIQKLWQSVIKFLSNLSF